MTTKQKEQCRTCLLWVAPPPAIIHNYDKPGTIGYTIERMSSDLPGKCRWMPTPIEKPADDLCGQWRARE